VNGHKAFHGFTDRATEVIEVEFHVHLVRQGFENLDIRASHGLKGEIGTLIPAYGWRKR
jgi:hypothetical protein